MINKTVSHYTILNKIGEGGMGEVFLAQDTRLDRRVALKFLSRQLEDDAGARARFLREARAAAALDHPFICKVYETGEAEGRAFIAMEYVEGETLEERLQRGTPTLVEALQIASEIAEALELAHQNGVVHRDLKPSNVALTPQGHVKVMDFGLAKRVAPGEFDSAAVTRSDFVTEKGAALGTLAYMSPEQARGESVDARSDIFSFGLLLYELFTGKHPFRHRSALEILSAILRDPAPPLDEKTSGRLPGLDRILRRCLAKNPSERYQTTRDLALDLKDLRDSLAGKTERRASRLQIAAAVLLIIALASGLWWLAQRSPPSVEVARSPLSILVADFQNSTGDPVFEGALEQTTALALEGAPFITAYDRSRARRIAAQLRDGQDRLDEGVLPLVAQREGIAVVVEGAISRQGESYRLSLRAVDPLKQEQLALVEGTARNKDGVLKTLVELVTRLRSALGDTTPQSVQLAAAETFTAASLEAAQNYSRAQELHSQGKWADAIPYYTRAVELDPGLGRAYAGLAVMYRNLGQHEQAEKQYQLAMSHIDRMTDREKYRTRGGYYITVQDYQHAIEEFTAVVREYPADFVGHSNLALAYFFARDIGRALEEQKAALEIYPKNAVMRSNLALYAMYAGDFSSAEREARVVLESLPTYEDAYLCLALSQLGQGRVSEASGVYEQLSGVSAWGASRAASGLADLAFYEGRLRDAVAILEKGIEADLANDDLAAAARKTATLGRAYLLTGEVEKALEAAGRAAAQSQEDRVLYVAARIYLNGGRENKARHLASRLASRLQPGPRLLAKLIEGEIQLKRQSARQAIQHFKEAQQVADTWLGRFFLGRAYLETGAYTEAYSEFEQCLKRRGEATALFLDDLPTYHYFPPVYYYLGRAQEGLKSKAAADSYQTFLSIKSAGQDDPLVSDARTRLAAFEEPGN